METLRCGVRMLGFGVVVLAAACVASGERSEIESSDSVAVADDGSEIVVGALPAELDVAAAVNLSCFATAEEPPEDFNRVLDVVALPARPTFRNALQTSELVTADGTVYYFAKTGLWYRADAAFELEIPDDLKPVMAFGWGGPEERSHTLNVACDRSDEWVALPGGYWVSEPMCSEVIVRAGALEERVEIGIGEPCSGQAPLEGSSDG